MEGIFKLSNVIFSEDECKVLELGLKFALDRNLFDTFIDFQTFIRKINITFFYAKNSGPSSRGIPTHT